ncbi:MAG: hypothetical protein C4539_07815 [Ignavibacteriales bacterium]|nr:MAG: hypothetical protein C4539_07815 [Ignavibacteriales bacterium]
MLKSYIIRNIIIVLISTMMFALFSSCATSSELFKDSEQGFKLGIHVLMDSKESLDAVKNDIPKLSQSGIDFIITEINYHYEYQSHPELRGYGHITKEEIRNLLETCKEYNIELIPQFQCLGHQSWASETFTLLTVYPEFDETPGQYPNNENIYCRSWCPLHPEINPIIFDLMDELVDAFDAKIFHVGMDEVFLIGSEFCPRCNGKDPAFLFSKAVNDYYNHLVRKRGLEMMMWGDRLIDTASTGYSHWEASNSRTHLAIDSIPKDIIICDWHYAKLDQYPSIPIFLKKGFRILPSSWKDVDAANALLEYSLKHKNQNMLGHLLTTWKKPVAGEFANHPTIKPVSERLGKMK